MYIDGHEREGVVTYHQQFVNWFLTCYTPWMHTWDNDGIEMKPIGFHSPEINGCFRIIPVTHDESTFYANDERKTQWIHESQKAAPERKGEGTSIMISDFLTSEWGCLTSADGTECVILSFDQIFIPQMHIDTEMLGSYSRLGRIAMAILMPKTSLPRLTKPSRALKTGLMDLQLACFYLIMLQAIKSVQVMCFLPTRCLRIQTMDGDTIEVALACDQLLLLMDMYKNFTLQMTIRNIRDFSKGWNK
jgi:hypothetical protein